MISQSCDKSGHLGLRSVKLNHRQKKESPFKFRSNTQISARTSNHLVTNLVSTLTDLDVDNFPHYIEKHEASFPRMNPQFGLISLSEISLYLARSTELLINLRLVR